MQVFYLKVDEPNKEPFSLDCSSPDCTYAMLKAMFGEKADGGAMGGALSGIMLNAPLEDDKDSCEELLSEELTEFDVNENSAGGGAHAHLCAPSVHPNEDSGASCCPVGEKGETGETGMYEEELVIKKALDSLADSQINMASESARIFLAKEIAKDLRDAGMLPHCPF